MYKPTGEIQSEVYTNITLRTNGKIATSKETRIGYGADGVKNCDTVKDICYTDGSVRQRSVTRCIYINDVLYNESHEYDTFDENHAITGITTTETYFAYNAAKNLTNQSYARIVLNKDANAIEECNI